MLLKAHIYSQLERYEQHFNLLFNETNIRKHPYIIIATVCDKNI